MDITLHQPESSEPLPIIDRSLRRRNHGKALRFFSFACIFSSPFPAELKVVVPQQQPAAGREGHLFASPILARTYATMVWRREKTRILARTLTLPYSTKAAPVPSMITSTPQAAWIFQPPAPGIEMPRWQAAEYHLQLPSLNCRQRINTRHLANA
jgi:hypothetical protein